MLSPSSRAGLALFLLSQGCVGGQSTDDVIGDKPSQPCVPQRMPISEPWPELESVLTRLFTSHTLSGRYGVPEAWLSFTPSAQEMDGTLEIARSEGSIDRLTTCMPGIEVPVQVTFRTHDGAFDERVSGSVLIAEGFQSPRVDGSPAPFEAQLRASFPFAERRGSFQVDAAETWAYGQATLTATITPFGTRGQLRASIDPKQPPKASTGSVQTAPASDGFLYAWPVAESCSGGRSGDDRPIALESTAETRALLDAIERVSAMSIPARYGDGTATTFSAEIEPPPHACGEVLPTMVHITTGDGRVDVSLSVFLDPIYALLHWNQRTDIAWGMPPALFAERVGRVAVDSSGMALIGLESWFDERPEPTGWLKLFGWEHGECLLCEPDQACIECPTDERATTLLTLLVGAQASAPSGR
jgi:hypothetical protein